MLSKYEGKKVLVTGHTGFKGTWLSIWLNKLGANVVGLSDKVPTNPSNYDVSNICSIVEDNRIDICDSAAVKELILDVKPDFVFHLAAQALVRSSYESPVETIRVNALGSASVLDALRYVSKETVALMITSDKAYENVEWCWGYRENDSLGGKDPYSASKGMAELAIHGYLNSYFKEKNTLVKLGITRAGNVIGGGDWALDRIVPDCVRAWADNKTVEIRSPKATRPWQHVLEPLSGYLGLGASLATDGALHGEAFNFGPAANQDQSVSGLIEEMKKYWESVSWKDVSDSIEKFQEAGLLKLNCDKALLKLGWLPTLDFSDTVKLTIDWYREYYNGNQDMLCFSSKQIDYYTKAASDKGIDWALSKK